MHDLSELSTLVRQGKANDVRTLTEELIGKGTPAQTIIKEGLIPAMTIVGQQMSTCEIYLPDVLQAARAMRASTDVLKPYLAKGEATYTGRIVIGTVKGDMHDIGKNIVGYMLQGAGIEVIDLGVNTPPEKFVEAVRMHKPDLVGLSALLTTTMGAMKQTIEALAAAGLRSNLKIMVGGAPTTQHFADEIGADGHARDAATAVTRAKELLAARAA